jgi:tetratricopeptide (TPR) repeat protein
MISFQEQVAAEVAVRVAGDNAAIAKHMADISRNKLASELTTYEAVLRFWQNETSLTPQTMMDAIRVLEHAVAREPDYGQAWSMLASLYADNYGLEIVDLPTPLEMAAAYARKGANLDPVNRRARMLLGHVRFMQNRLREAQREAEIAYNLCPNSLLGLDGIGWLITMAGEWELGLNCIKKAMALNPHFRPRVRHALCINWFRLGDYEKAYQETLHFTMPEFFWDKLLKASACGHLGRIEEGQASVRSLLALKPDFARRGRVLIGRYIKFEDIADRIVEGLDKLGMHVD